MTDGYTGWKLFDKVTIVAKQQKRWDPDKWEYYTVDEYQGYLVDPSNKKQLETARKWAEQEIWSYYTDEKGQRDIKQKEVIPATEYTYDNNDFTLELYNSAGSSSQGGKLSFWNCWITAPDGKKFLIGIAADLLLDVLKSSTVVNGIVQDKLMFARCNGGVGMLHNRMENYQQALNDAETRSKMKKGKTSKHVVGHIYETATQKNAYLGKFYIWYEPVYKPSNNFWGTNELVGFRKLKTPQEVIFFPSVYPEKTKFSDYFDQQYNEVFKAPARRESEDVIELDCTMQDYLNYQTKKYVIDHSAEYLQHKKEHPNLTYHKWMSDNRVGLSTSNKSYELPQEVRDALTSMEYQIWEE